jgi:hypothetical protein
MIGFINVDYQEIEFMSHRKRRGVSAHLGVSIDSVQDDLSQRVNFDLILCYVCCNEIVSTFCVSH